jgi:acetyltransferase-like isoleucine patch superfamily enzyme
MKRYLKTLIMRYYQNNSFISVFIKDLRKDFLGTLAFSLRYFYMMVRRVFWILINYLHFKIIGIKIGSSNNFIGWCIISRFPQSSISIGDGCSFNSAKNVNLIGVNHNCIISTQERNAIITIKNNCGCSGVTIAAFNKIEIGNNVKIGANVLITDSDWHPEDARSRQSKPIIIDDNVWLGVNCTILKGVTIGANSIIGANSVVTGNIPENVIAAGNPCKVIKKL